MHAALYLVVVLAGGAAQFILLGQEFVAWVQVLVYIGAVIVLFLFGIMLTRAPMHPDESLDNDLRWPGAAAALFLAGILGALLVRHVPRRQGRTSRRRSAPPRSPNAIFRVYIIPFEVVGVLLLGALIGAVVLARKDYRCCSTSSSCSARSSSAPASTACSTRKHTVLVLMSIELMLAAVNINLVAFGALHTPDNA